MAVLNCQSCSTTLGGVIAMSTVLLALFLAHTVECMPRSERVQLKNEVKALFYNGYDHYMRNAFPADELKSLTCGGLNTFGGKEGYMLTLIDSLDALAIMGNRTGFTKEVQRVIQSANFEMNETVSVFETNIRIVGGLLAAHLLATDGEFWSDSNDYNGELLELANEVGKRLLPAFDTPTGIPYGAINLMSGVDAEESNVTCVAGAGTFSIEFGLLSQLTGNPAFEIAAKRAVRSIWEHRASETNLIGNHVNIVNGEWPHQEAGVGAGVDSYFEYLIKAAILFEDIDYASLFERVLPVLEASLRHGNWFFDVNMYNGKVVWPLFNSLQGFWPGTLAQAGLIDAAEEIMDAFHAVWRRYGGVPEGFNLHGLHVQPGQQGYPLRPELAESAYHLFRATGKVKYLYMGRDYISALQEMTTTSCGNANVRTVDTGEVLDRMESFFLSETCKYLYLLFDEENFINLGNFVFTTEGHPVDVERTRRDVTNRQAAATYGCSISNMF